MWPGNSVLIIINASVLLVHSLPPNILSTVQNDSSSIVQNEKYLQLFLQLATRAADRLIRLRNQADKTDECNRPRDNLLPSLKDPRTQLPPQANLERPDKTQDETQSQLFLSDSEDNKTERHLMTTSSDAVVHNDEVSSSTQKSVFNSDTENVTTAANESNSDARSSENPEVDGIAERFFNPFNLQTLHASTPTNDLINTGNKILAQTHKLQSMLGKSKLLVNNTLCLQYAQNLSGKIDGMSKILDLPLDKLHEDILSPQDITSLPVLSQIVSSAINVVKSVIEKLPASFLNNATLFKQIIPHLEKLQASLNNVTVFDQIIPHNFTNIPSHIAEESRKSSEDILKSGREFIGALRSRVNEFSSQLHGNQNTKSNSEVIEADKTNTLERDNRETSTEFANNSEIQSNNSQPTPTLSVNPESTLAPLLGLLPNSDDDKNHTENLNGAQNNLQNSESVTDVEIPEAPKDDPSNNTKHRSISSHIDNNQSELDNYTRLIEKLEQIGKLRDDPSKAALQNIDDQILRALRPIMDTELNSD